MCVCVRARGEKIKSDCKIRINRGEDWGVGLRVERLPRAGSGCKNPVEEICGGLGLNWKKKGRFSQRRSLYPSHHRRRECRKKERQENSKQIAAGHGTSVADCGRNRTTAEGGRGHQRHRHQTKKNPLKSKERRRFFSCPSPCQVCVCVCECVCVRPCLSVCVCECVRVRGLRKRSRFSPVEPETVTSSADSLEEAKHRKAVAVVIFVNKNKRRNNDGGHRAALVRVPWIILRR